MLVNENSERSLFSIDREEIALLVKGTELKRLRWGEMMDQDRPST